LGYQSVLFERLLTHIDYDDETLVLMDDLYWGEASGSKATYQDVFAWVDSWGTTLLYNPDERRLQLPFPNSRQANRKLTPMNLTVVPPTEKLRLSKYDDYSRVYFITASWREGFEQYQPIKGLSVLEEGVVGYRYWQLEYMRLK
jgi:hypothetical protein